MKTHHLTALSLSVSLLLAACGGGSTPSDPGTTTPSTPVSTPVTTPTTATLTLSVSGVSSAPVKVTDSAGNVRFDGAVSGSASVPNLPLGKYTVTAGAVTNYTAPAAQTADLSSGSGALTLAYTALPGTGLSSNAVSGVIPDWKSGAASAVVAHVYTTNGQFSSTSGVISPAGTVTPDGTLNIPLPSSIDSSYLSSIFPANSTTCTFSGTATDPTLQSDWYARRLIQVGDSPLGIVQEFVVGSPADNRHLVERVYVPADVTVKGTYSCNAGTSSSYTETYDLTLSKGWNTVEAFKTGTTNPGSTYDNYTYRTLAAGARVELQYTPYAPGIQMSLSDSSTLTLKRGDKATRSLKITQLGNYSGTVSLGSSVAGVSVDPATITLAPVTSQAIKALSAQAKTDPRALRRLEEAQALAPASVTTTLTFTASADAAQHDGVSTDLLTAKDASGTTLASTSLPITVSVPSVTGNVYVSSLDRGQSQTSSVSLYTNNGYSGPVTVSVENLPDGVSVPSVQANISGYSASTNLTFTASATAATGTKTAQLVVNAGGIITRSDVTVTVNKPTVQVTLGNYSYTPLTVRRGQTQNLSVSVSGQHGFSGNTTLTLSGLPAGVTASPLTVNVAAGTTTSAVIPVTASDSADYGTATVKVTGDDLDATAYSQPQFSLSVASGVTATLSDSARIATAGNGLWVVSQNGSYTNGNYSYPVKRYEGSQLKLSTTLTVDSSSGVPMSTPGGDLVFPGSSKVYVVKSDGTISSVNFSAVTTSTPSYYVTSNIYTPKIVDAQNRLWYAASVSGNSSGNSTVINTLDLSTGATAAVTGVTPANSYFTLYRNADGSTIYYVPNSSSGSSTTVSQLNAATGVKTRDITLPGVSSISSLAVAQDGTLWGTAYSSVFRLNADGTLSTFSGLSNVSRLVFDAVSSTTLWGYSSSTAYKIDATSGTSTSIPVGASISDIAADKAGGIWAYTSDYNYSSGSSYSYLLSLIK